jgi:hypothetical protein
MINANKQRDSGAETDWRGATSSDGLVLVWNLRVSDRPEYEFTCQSEVSRLSYVCLTILIFVDTFVILLASHVYSLASEIKKVILCLVLDSTLIAGTFTSHDLHQQMLEQPETKTNQTNRWNLFSSIHLRPI